MKHIQKRKFATSCRKVRKGEIMAFTIKAVGQEHILQPIRAEPMIGENSPLHKENNTTIKKKG